MATLTIHGNTFTPRSPSVSIVGQVNAEQVTFVVDESWSGLELQAQFSNASIDREPIPVALDETMTCFVPSEATEQPGKVYVALAGYDDGVQIKLTELLHYSNARVGADPNGGIPPEEQTPSYLNQITQILNETKAVADSVRTDADNGEFDGPEGPPGKSPEIRNGTWWVWDEEEQKWVDTGILAAGKNGISPKVATQPVTGGTRVIITDADGEKFFDVLNGKNGNPGKNGETPNITIGRVDTLPSGSKATAEITGQTPSLTLNMGIPQGREGPAGLGLPTPTPEDAGKFPMVNPEGNGYIFGKAGGGGAGGELLLAEYIHQGNQEIYFSSFDWASGIGECTEPHGLTEAKKVLLVPNEWWTGSDFIGKGITSIPIEWIIYTGANIYVVPTDETHVKITGSDKETIIQVDTGDVSNTLIDATKFHVELPIGFSIKELPIDCTSIRVFAFGITGTLSYRYISLYTNRTYRAKIWPEGFLTPPATGLSKAKYALVFWYDICAEAVPAGAVFVMNNLYKAQRKGYSYWVGDCTSEYLVMNYGKGSDNKAEIFTGLLIENGYACYANHTVFRLYARAVKRE